jgi:hypothetical protein
MSHTHASAARRYGALLDSAGKKAIARFVIFVKEMQKRRPARGKAREGRRVALMKIADGVHELPCSEAQPLSVVGA